MGKKPKMMPTEYGSKMKPPNEWQMNTIVELFGNSEQFPFFISDGYEAYFKLCKAKARANPKLYH